MKSSSTEHGAAFLEAAIATAILAAMLLGILDLSRRSTSALRHSGEAWRSVWALPRAAGDSP